MKINFLFLGIWVKSIDLIALDPIRKLDTILLHNVFVPFLGWNNYLKLLVTFSFDRLEAMLLFLGLYYFPQNYLGCFVITWLEIIAVSSDRLEAAL